MNAAKADKLLTIINRYKDAYRRGGLAESEYKQLQAAYLALTDGRVAMELPHADCIGCGCVGAPIQVVRKCYSVHVPLCVECWPTACVR